jgi:menaquinone-dependent protoporphyrinogen IX oxidase
MKKVLITYYSKTNTTKEYADTIKQVFSEHNFDVTLQDFNNENNLKNYDLVIIGAPINGMKWAENATNFVEKNKEQLKQTQVAYFIVSYFLNVARKPFRKAIYNSLNEVSKQVEPISIGRFLGRVDKPLPKFLHFVLAGRSKSPLDQVNLEDAKLWATNLIKDI